MDKANQSARPTNAHAHVEINQQERHGFYKTLFNRRDVRSQFKPDPIPDATLSRILYAAHHAPSVGYMQPWNFIVIRSNEVRQKVHQDFCNAHQEAEQQFDQPRQETYRNFKLEGILESPVNICITCDRSRTGKTVIGRTQMSEMDLYSSVCAVQNFWLAARTEGLGVGWVSILHHDVLRQTLKLPDSVVPIAYLCVGYVSHFANQPDLQKAGWLPRLPLEQLVAFDQWGQQADDSQQSLIDQIQQDQPFPHSFNSTGADNE